MSAVSTECTNDYLEIPIGQNVDGGALAANVAMPLVLGTFPDATVNRYCGRVLHTTTQIIYIEANSVSVCCKK